MHRVCCFRWWRHFISRTADVWLELVSLVSSILPPPPRFRAVICYWPLCLQTRHMWRWLTCVQLWMQNRCQLVYQTFLTNQDRPYTSVTEMAWNMQMSTNDNSINARFCWQTRIRSRHDFHIFCYTDGLFKKKKYACEFVFLRKKFFSAIFDFHVRENPRFRDEFQALNMQMLTGDTSPSTLYNPLATNLHSFMSWFHTFWKLCVCTAGQVGRSATTTAAFKVSTCLTVDRVWSMFVHKAMSQFQNFAFPATHAWSLNKTYNQKVH